MDPILSSHLENVRAVIRSRVNYINSLRNLVREATSGDKTAYEDLRLLYLNSFGHTFDEKILSLAEGYLDLNLDVYQRHTKVIDSLFKLPPERRGKLLKEQLTKCEKLVRRMKDDCDTQNEQVLTLALIVKPELANNSLKENRRRLREAFRFRHHPISGFDLDAAQELVVLLRKEYRSLPVQVEEPGLLWQTFGIASSLFRRLLPEGKGEEKEEESAPKDSKNKIRRLKLKARSSGKKVDITANLPKKTERQVSPVERRGETPSATGARSPERGTKPLGEEVTKDEVKEKPKKKGKKVKEIYVELPEKEDETPAASSQHLPEGEKKQNSKRQKKEEEPVKPLKRKHLRTTGVEIPPESKREEIRRAGPSPSAERVECSEEIRRAERSEEEKKEGKKKKPVVSLSELRGEVEAKLGKRKEVFIQIFKDQFLHYYHSYSSLVNCLEAFDGEVEGMWGSARRLHLKNFLDGREVIADTNEPIYAEGVFDQENLVKLLSSESGGKGPRPSFHMKHKPGHSERKVGKSVVMQFRQVFIDAGLDARVLWSGEFL